MDSYPEDLLVPVSPLIFCVNSILPQDITEGRSVYDRFLDSLVASLSNEVTPTSPSPKHHEDDSSDDEILEKSLRSRRPGALTGSFYGFKRRANNKKGDDGSLSYAQALTGGQSFFQRARVESVSLKHGFPPSKDPHGNKSVAFMLKKAKDNDEKMMIPRIFHDRPIQGILPTGWLEKHVHALPSALILVATVSASQQKQDEQDKLLFETIDNMESGLAVKRDCAVHVVGLVHDDVAPNQAFAWSDTVYNKLAEYQQINPKESTDRVTLIRISTDLESAGGFSTSEALQLLHQSIRKHSLSYYSKLARRNKTKFGALFLFNATDDTDLPPEVLPLAVRYAFKAAIYYEFQWRHEQSIKWMSEAYRLLTKYFEFITSGKTSEPSPVARSLIDGEGGVEVSIGNDSKLYKELRETIPDDMTHQCRGVAEWLNLKLLLTGFGSHTEFGLISASNQWRQHNRYFCSLADAQSWKDWSYVARQRLVVSQLVERHPPTALGTIGFEHDEILIRCSPWRCYESAAEALLRLAVHLEKGESSSSPIDESERGKSLRPPYVGSLDSDGLDNSLREELKKNHRQSALDVVLRGIQVFENELMREKRGFHAEDDFMERSASRMGARLSYMAGGLLLGMGRYEEAVDHLEVAAKYCHGWYELQLAVRRLLIVCFRNGARPTNKRSKGNETLASMILDSYFNAEMSADDLRTALTHFVTSSGQESLKWFHEAKGDDDENVPFTFRVSFPKCLFSTVGDSAEANVIIKSNLDYAIYVNSISLKSLAGTLVIPQADLMRATNALEGNEGQGIIIPKKGEIEINTLLHLPKNLEGIAVDESGNGGEILGTAGKGSFAKSARPRSAGITAAAGARFLSEDSIDRGDAQSQGWDLRFLGGKPLRCDGLGVEFYPLQAERVAGTSDQITPIELTIERQKSRTQANIKRTPFEEENYIASAWSAPLGASIPPGPRSLRVLVPRSNLTIKNLTDPLSQGQALEGTVNRVLLKLEAGSTEKCHDISVKVSIFSVLVTSEGKTLRIIHDRDPNQSVEDCVYSSDPIVRTPVLVGEDLRSSSESHSFGFELPRGWSLSENGMEYTIENVTTLDKEDSIYLPINVFRPASYVRSDRMRGDKVFDFDPIDCLCRTDFYISVTYRQERATKVKKKPQRVSRQRPRMSSKKMSESASEIAEKVEQESSEPEKDPDIVTTEYSGNVIWTQPLQCEYEEGAQSRALLHEDEAEEGVDTQLKKTIRLTKGALVPFVCKVSAVQLDPDLSSTIERIQLRVPDDSQVEICSKITSDTGPWTLASPSSKVSTAYAMKIRDDYNPRATSLMTVGTFDVAWSPSALRHDPEVNVLTTLVDQEQGDILHGPLPLQEPIVLSFDGPECIIEKDYFEVRVDASVDVPRVGEPFVIEVVLANQTAARQQVALRLIHQVDLFVDGPSRTIQDLAPLEKKVLKFTAIAPYAGRLRLPRFDLEGNRWKLRDDSANQRILYALPA